jgi:hypothetical protein
VEIRAHPIPQVDRLADVDYSPLGILIQIAAGLTRQRIQLPFQAVTYLSSHNEFRIGWVLSNRHIIPPGVKHLHSALHLYVKITYPKRFSPIKVCLGVDF